jgi:hypothetical protein
MDISLYAGNNTGQTVTNSGGFQPDLVWVKTRNATEDHGLFDAVRGANRWLGSNTTSAESLISNSLSFASNGFTLSSGAWNESGKNIVGWNWNAGGSTVTNTSGSISAQVRANPTAGFSVVTFTATGSNATVGHGLGVAPAMIITKQRNTTGSWATYHASLGNTQLIYLNSTGAALGPSSAYWNNTSPTSTVFTFGGALASNGDTIVAYCFAAVPSYSAFGSYVGNGSTDGPFVFTGFRPRFVMIKRTETSGDGWILWDSARSPSNITSVALSADSSGAEFSYSTLDLLSNGMKVRGTAGNTAVNASGSTYIYMAFAENPFKNALAR